MFLDLTVRRNPALIEAAVALHQAGRIPAGSYVLDLDAMAANAEAFVTEARRLGLTVLGMTKQIGRNPAAMHALAGAGLDRFVAVDMADARAIVGAGHRVGHVGHLVQVPRAEAPAAAAMRPDWWAVFSDAKASEAAAAAAGVPAPERVQPLLARIQRAGDTFYAGHEGGFDAAEVLAVADRIDALDGARFAGVTTFPALLFDAQAGEIRATPNLSTLADAVERLTRAGRGRIEVNAPGTTSTSVLPLLADAGATQVEPGHGLTGTTPLHAVRDLVETPAAIYLTEVSHRYGGRAYCFGTGFYIDPVFPDYEVHALVGTGGRAAAMARVPATVPPPGMIDYYGQLHTHEAAEGASVVFGFRMQAFFRRAFVAPLRGVASGSPRVEGVYTADGARAAWPG